VIAKNDFVLEWDKALGFKEDPFADKIFTPISDFLVDRADEKEKLNWFFIKNYFFGSIVGEHGVGKTMLLKWLEDRLTRYNRIYSVYINATVFREQINIPQQMLMPLLSFFEKNFSKPHATLSSMDYLGFLKKKLGSKAIVLLIDNAHNLTDKNLELIKSLREEGLHLQIIITSTPQDYEKSRLTELEHDELKINLGRLTFEESVDMIRKRVIAFGGKGISPFTEENLKELYEKADKNPRQFLHLCRDEAIKILIHKKDVIDKQRLQAMKEPQSLKTMPKKADDMDIKIRRADKEEAKEEVEAEKKKLFRIRFALGKDKGHQQPANPHTSQAMREERPDRKAIYDDKHKQALVNQLNSTSPRKKSAMSGKNDTLSDTERILRELSDEFER
jgi:type II secretory pathway predicted ATPase ExeA/ribosomal protein L29